MTLIELIALMIPFVIGVKLAQIIFLFLDMPLFVAVVAIILSGVLSVRLLYKPFIGIMLFCMAREKNGLLILFLLITAIIIMSLDYISKL